MRTDKKRNVDKVAAELVKNPLATERELAKSVNIPKSTVHRAKKELGQNGAKDERIISLTNDDFNIQTRIQELKIEKLKSNPNEISDSDLNNWDKHSTARYSLFRGSITDASGGLCKINTSDLDEQQADEALDTYISEGHTSE